MLISPLVVLEQDAPGQDTDFRRE